MLCTVQTEGDERPGLAPVDAARTTNPETPISLNLGIYLGLLKGFITGFYKGSIRKSRNIP